MPDVQPYDPPLSGVKVLDISSGPLRAVSRIYADLGADITHVELAGVTNHVAFGPVVDGVEITEALNSLGVTSLRLDRSDEGDAAQWRQLLADADILIESTTPNSPEESALNVDAIHVARPELVILSISDFGRSTRFSGWKGTSPVFHSLTGELSRTGSPNREPLIPPGELPYETAAAQAAFMTLAVYLDRLRTGHGELIDFSILEGAMQALDPAFGMAGSAAMGQSMSSLPRGRVDMSHQYPIIPCKDGYVRICVLAKRQWHGMFEWMGRPKEFADPKFDDLHVRFATPSLVPAIGRFFADKTRAELEEQGQTHGVPTAAVLSVEEALHTPQIQARGFFREVEIAPGLCAPVPVGVMEVDGARASALDITVPDASGVPAEQSSLPEHAPLNEGRPLEGLKVVDFGVIIVGGDTTRMLGDLGAEVIKVENSGFPDGARASLPPGKMMPGFASGHRNKKSIGINVQDPEGLALTRKLIADADLVFTNWKPGVMQKLGLDYDALKEINPGVVVADSSAFGQSGPWAKRLGYGPLVRAAAGFTEQWTYPGEPGSFQDAITVYPDHVCSRISAVGALSLLIRRERTGRGGSVSQAQAEVMMSHMVPALVARSLAATGHQVEAPVHDAPWGLFPAAGDDEWVTVTVRNDAEWTALARAIGHEELLADPALAAPAGRDAQRARIDAAVTAWTSQHSPDDVMEQLQAAGVPAAKMLRGNELPAWEFYRERRDFREEMHPYGDMPFTLENVQMHAEHIPDPPLGQAPLLGEQTVEIARNRLGLSEDEIARLVERGVLEVAVIPTPIA